MKVLDEAMDQCLLCIDYAFDQDSPANREVSLRRLQPGIRQKEWWRYHHVYRGLRTLVAYEGSRAVGHVEFMPIEYAPRPVVGQHLAFPTACMWRLARSRGGRRLLEAAEHEARKRLTAGGHRLLVGPGRPGVLLHRPATSRQPARGDTAHQARPR
jgi:hypothetical protein